MDKNIFINVKKTFLILGICFSTVSIAQVGVDTTTPRGALDVSSTTQGIVFPNVALVNINTQTAINPQGGAIPAGTVVYNTATSGAAPNNVAPGLYYWNGSRWVAFAGSPGGLDWSLTGNSGTTAGTNFLGTTDAQDLRLFTNNIERARILSTGTIGVNSAGSTFSQVYVQAAGTNDAVAGRNDDTVANAFWGLNLNTGGTAIIGAANGIGGYFPTTGAGVAGSTVDGYGISGMVGNGAPNNSAHNGHSAGYFSLDSDNNATTSNPSAFAKIAGKDEQSVPAIGVPSRRILYGGYFIGGTATGGQSYSYVGLKYNHNNDLIASGGTNYKVVGNGSNSTLIMDKDGEPRVLFSPEAPEILFQDFGTGKLKNGEAKIVLDDLLVNSIYVDQQHPIKVFIQLEGDCNGVYVTNKSEKGFTVKELSNGKSNVNFSWQIVANRADSKDNNGNITSKHVGLRFPYGPKPLQQTEISSKKMDRLKK